MANTRALPKTGLALAVLSLLNEGPVHPYEMKVMMKQRGHGEVIKLKGGSLYDTVERLLRGGFIEPQETSREGRRPERTVYALTENGRDELRLWLLELLATPAEEYPQFAAALAFFASLEKEEVIQTLQRRMVMLEARVAATQMQLRVSAEMGVPALFVVEVDYGQAMARAEIAWVKQLVAQIKDGDMWLTRAQMQAVADAMDPRQGGGP